MFNSEDEFYQWMAGIVDSEGSFNLKYLKQKRNSKTIYSRQASLCIKTCDDHIVPTISKWTNKQFSDNDYSKCIRFVGGDLKKLIPKITKYLFTKQPHADLCFKSLLIKNGECTAYTNEQKNEWNNLYNKMKKINQRGIKADEDNLPRSSKFTWPWLAGFIDGDGTIVLSKHGSSKIIVKISLAHPKTINYIGEVLDINPIVSSKQKGNKRKCTCIRMMPSNVLKYGNFILPYLVLKQHKMKLAIELSEIRNSMKNGENKGPRVDKAKMIIENFKL